MSIELLEPKTSDVTSTGVSSDNKPLRDCVITALDNYFSQLGDQEPSNLYDLVVREVEAPLLEKVMGYTRGNQTRAAILLGISRGTLRKKLKIYGLLD